MKTTEEIDAKAKEVFEIARRSATPLSVMGEITACLKFGGVWTTSEVELVNEGVIRLLVRHGWNRVGTQ